VPQVPRVPYQDGSLTLAVTHKFPRGGINYWRSDKCDLPNSGAAVSHGTFGGLFHNEYGEYD